MRGDRTGEEQPLWLKPDDICLHMTMVYALLDNSVDSGLKMVLKVYRPGEPVTLMAAVASMQEEADAGMRCRQRGASPACALVEASRRR